LKRIRIPPIGGLISFVAAARHGSFTSAARELNLSQAAVSRQIRELEGHLGIPLFQRIRQRVVLTEAGKLYVSHVRKPLDELASASRKVAALSSDTTLNLAVLPTFASRWLMPRLPSFQNEHPTVTIHLTTPQSAHEFSTEPFDAGVFHCSPDWPGATACHLLDMELVPVCSPRLNVKRAVGAPADLAKFPLLHLKTRPNRWSQWLAEMGVTLDAPLLGHSYQNSTMVAQAAVAGLGIALMPRRLFEDELANGRLEIVGGHFPRLNISYHLVLSEARAASPIIQDFAAWLQDEAREWVRGEDRGPTENNRLDDNPRAGRARILDLAYRDRSDVL
jgi:LysR family glycine cleavage system transcriptional activator